MKKSMSVIFSGLMAIASIATLAVSTFAWFTTRNTNDSAANIASGSAGVSVTNTKAYKSFKTTDYAAYAGAQNSTLVYDYSAGLVPTNQDYVEETDAPTEGQGVGVYLVNSGENFSYANAVRLNGDKATVFVGENTPSNFETGVQYKLRIHTFIGGETFDGFLTIPTGSSARTIGDGTGVTVDGGNAFFTVSTAKRLQISYTLNHSTYELDTFAITVAPPAQGRGNFGGATKKNTLSTSDVFYLNAGATYDTNKHWTDEGARFAVYLFKNETTYRWVSMTAVDGNSGYYSFTLPSTTYTKAIFCRMNGSTSDNNWDNKWNQTSDLTLDGHQSQVYTITGWDNSGRWEYWSKDWKDVYVLYGSSTNSVSSFYGNNFDPYNGIASDPDDGHGNFYQKNDLTICPSDKFKLRHWNSDGYLTDDWISNEGDNYVKEDGPTITSDGDEFKNFVCGASTNGVYNIFFKWENDVAKLYIVPQTVTITRRIVVDGVVQPHMEKSVTITKKSTTLDTMGARELYGYNRTDDWFSAASGDDTIDGTTDITSNTVVYERFTHKDTDDGVIQIFIDARGTDVTAFASATNLYIQYFKGNTDATNTGFPGIMLTSTGTAGLYSTYMPKDVTKTVISSGSSSLQTADIDHTSGSTAQVLTLTGGGTYSGYWGMLDDEANGYYVEGNDTFVSSIGKTGAAWTAASGLPFGEATVLYPTINSGSIAKALNKTGQYPSDFVWMTGSIGAYSDAAITKDSDENFSFSKSTRYKFTLNTSTSTCLAEDLYETPEDGDGYYLTGDGAMINSNRLYDEGDTNLAAFGFRCGHKMATGQLTNPENTAEYLGLKYTGGHFKIHATESYTAGTSWFGYQQLGNDESRALCNDVDGDKHNIELKANGIYNIFLKAGKIYIVDAGNLSTDDYKIIITKASGGDPVVKQMGVGDGINNNAFFEGAYPIDAGDTFHIQYTQEDEDPLILGCESVGPENDFTTINKHDGATGMDITFLVDGYFNFYISGKYASNPRHIYVTLVPPGSGYYIAFGSATTSFTGDNSVNYRNAIKMKTVDDSTLKAQYIGFKATASNRYVRLASYFSNKQDIYRTEHTLQAATKTSRVIDKDNTVQAIFQLTVGNTYNIYIEADGRVSIFNKTITFTDMNAVSKSAATSNANIMALNTTMVFEVTFQTTSTVPSNLAVQIVRTATPSISKVVTYSVAVDPDLGGLTPYDYMRANHYGDRSGFTTTDNASEVLSLSGGGIAVGTSQTHVAYILVDYDAALLASATVKSYSADYKIRLQLESDDTFVSSAA